MILITIAAGFVAKNTVVDRRKKQRIDGLPDLDDQIVPGHANQGGMKFKIQMADFSAVCVPSYGNAHLLINVLKEFNILVFFLFQRELYKRGLQKHTQLDQLMRRFLRKHQLDDQRVENGIRNRRANKGALSAPDFDDVQGRKHLDRLADRVPADTELGRKLHFCRELVPRLEFSLQKLFDHQILNGSRDVGSVESLDVFNAEKLFH